MLKKGLFNNALKNAPPSFIKNFFLPFLYLKKAILNLSEIIHPVL